MPKERLQSASRPWRDGLALIVAAVVLWNAVILWLLYTGATDHETGNDAAGAGMARGFRQIFATASAIGIGVLALPPVTIRHRSVRIAFVVLLGFASCLTPLML